MSVEVGIGLAFVAMLCWGFGDFLIQKTTKKLGDWETLFVLTSFGMVVLFPFLYRRLPDLFVGSGNELMILCSSALVLLIASLMNFEAFKKGKLSVLEPLLSLEILAASLLAFFILGDRISWMQFVFIISLVVSLFMVSLHERYLSKKFFMEKGVIIFALGAVLMGFADFLLGWGARVTDPIMANFILNTVMTMIAGGYLVATGRAFKLARDIKEYRGRLLVMSISDNVAWIAYAFAMTLVPIAVATGLSESSIIVAVLLGLFVNKEKIQLHQKIGLVGAIASTIVLAA